MKIALHERGAASGRTGINRMVMSAIEHRYGDCTGHWRLIGMGDARSIRCDRCAREYPATADHRVAAIDENYAGIYLRRLTAEGASYLDPDRRRDD